MREIKFRAKRIDKDEFAYGDHLTGMGNKKGKHYILHLLSHYPSDCHSLDGYEVITDTIGQYTGLKDKNGKEIYEGDVLHIKLYENDGYRIFWSDVSFPNCFTLDECKGELLRKGNELVCFTDGCMCVGDMFISALFGDMRCSVPIFEFEVIGNIHDNPELIKEEQK